MREISRQELRQALRLEVGADGMPTHSSIAHAICRAVERWQLVPTARVIAHIRKQLAAAGLTSEDGVARVTEVYERLALLGVVEPVDLAGRAHCARAEPRWIRLSDDLAVLTGTTSALKIPVALSRAGADLLANLVVKFNPNHLDTLAYLKAQGVREWTLGDWRGELGFVEHLLRRNGKSSAPTLENFWEVLIGTMADDGLQLSADAAVRVVAGCPGDYFGTGVGAKPEGRWTAAPFDGIWCGVRAGYSEKHWQPILLKVDGEQRVALDLYDFDEWKWALLARGLALTNPERSKRTGDTVAFSYPLPEDIIRLLLLVAESRSGWTWKVPRDVPDVWTLS